MADSLATLLQSPVEVETKGIAEPIGNYSTVLDIIRQFFPETVYSHAPNTMLAHFLEALLGEAGVGGLKKRLVYPRASASLYNTYFSDLDAFYGSVFGFTRIESEVYRYSPDTELLTIDQLREVRSKDAAFQARALKFMRALQMGSTMEGLALLCEAVSGIECSVVEHWRYLDDQIADYHINPENLGISPSSSEIVIVPDTGELTLWEKRRISNAMNRYGPAATIFSINPKKTPRITIPIRSISSSSTYFQAERYVTGSPTTNYPRLDPKYGLWIESGVEHLKPAFAFSEGQETVTWITIEESSSSSYHVGNFNRTQRHIFEHLRDLEDPGYSFISDEGYVHEPVPLKINTPWVDRGINDRFTVVNGSMNLGYFSDSDINTRRRNMYWASKEALAPEGEFLQFSFGRERRINYIEFEIASKPVGFEIQFMNESGDWEPVEHIERGHLDDTLEVTFSLNSNVWHLARINFERIETSAIRIVFDRKEVPFPYPNSPSFPWSIEVRNTRVADILQDYSDLVTYPMVDGVRQIQAGRDILGNKYRTVVDPTKFAPSRVIDNDPNSYWQSQVTPDPYAVECLYLDIRQQDGGPSTVDEFFIDPVTSGCYMNVYWSNDDNPTDIPLMQTPEDWRLWTPDPSHYILAKGRHKFRRPITAKYLKFEFTKLALLPYPLSDVQCKEVRYKTHPSWTEKQINDAYEITPTSKVYDQNGEVVRNNYTNIGITMPDTEKLGTFPPKPLEEFDRTNIPNFEQVFSDYRNWEKQIDNAAEGRRGLQSDVEIELTPFETNLIESLPKDFETEAYLGDALRDPTFFTIEIPLRPKLVRSVGSVSDKSDLVAEKTQQELWFPVRSRHGYKVVETLREKDVGYHVAIKSLELYRSSYGETPYDHEVYIDNLVDNVNFSPQGNITMVRNESGWGLVPSQEFASPTNQEFGEYLFDYKPLVPWTPPLTELDGDETLSISDTASVDVQIENGSMSDSADLADSATVAHNVRGEADEYVGIQDLIGYGESEFHTSMADEIEFADEAEFTE